MSGKKILVVDDDPDIVEYVCTFLEDNGYEVCSAEGSEDAMSVLEGSSVDMIILDVLMPGRSGLDLLVTLRKDPRWAALPIVVLTGNDGVLQDGGKSYLEPNSGIRGAEEVLGKPLKPDELLSALERLSV